jgi:hypothetical protein
VQVRSDRLAYAVVKQLAMLVQHEVVRVPARAAGA